jgi:hypothetical protein
MHSMDPLTQLYERLRTQVCGARTQPEPAVIEAWLEYWNDDDSDLGNLRTFEHWLSQKKWGHSSFRGSEK